MITSAKSSYQKYQTRTRTPNPSRSALLVIDMQNHFSAIATPILRNLLTTIDICRRASIPVIFTRHIDDPNSGYTVLAEWWNGKQILNGTLDAELMPEIAPRVGEEVIEKNTYSAFVNTCLKERLEEMGVEEVIVTGVMTNLCCETSARDAFTRGYRVYFSSDATATSDLELHESSLRNLAFGFAYLVDCDKLQKWFDN